MKIVKEDKNKQISILHISGYMTSDNIDSFKKITSQCQEEKINKIILDMEKVNMIDSSGIGAIVFMLKRFRTSDGDVKIANAKGHVDEVFKMIKLNKTIDMYSSVKEALESF